MKVVVGLDAFSSSSPLALAIGSFDGVHIGHRHMLALARESALVNGLAFGIVTLDPVPAVVLNPDLTDYQLTPRSLKLELLAAVDPSILVVLPFTTDLAKCEASQFLSMIEKNIELRQLWMGDDFRFGHNREGDRRLLERHAQESDLTLHIVAREGAGAEAPNVSSSRIRDALRTGDLTTATQHLGRTFELQGLVVHGQARGRGLGYPTANLGLSPHQLVPLAGVYAGTATVRGVQYAAAISVGTNPQFDGNALTVEAYILDFDEDIYDLEIRVGFVKRLRGQERFANVDELLVQMASDVAETRKIMGPMIGGRSND